MTQIHKKFTVEQVRILFTSYEAGYISRSEIENTLGIGKTRFFALLKQFREHPDYKTSCPARLLHSQKEEKGSARSGSDHLRYG